MFSYEKMTFRTKRDKGHSESTEKMVFRTDKESTKKRASRTKLEEYIQYQVRSEREFSLNQEDIQ